ncbi:hypothetical protein N2603_38110 [Bradyrhizobium huanghuaihaiense]|nr:hypothetical protein [Bradyrhizobium sp. CB3035]UWU75742.1 hypothetical protein N2603_38110 [Bradyrhizobium sp. CB3035]
MPDHVRMMMRRPPWPTDPAGAMPFGIYQPKPNGDSALPLCSHSVS